MKLSLLITAYLASCCVAAPLSGGTSVKYDFDGYPVDAPLLESKEANDRWRVQTQDPSKMLSTVVREDRARLFGKSSFMKVLEISDQSNTNDTFFLVCPQRGDVGEKGYILCTFAEPADASHQGRGFILRLSHSPGNDNTAFALAIQNGRLITCAGKSVEPGNDVVADYRLDNAHELAIIFNNSESIAPYPGGQLEPQTMDIWLDGEKVAVGLPKCGGLETGKTIRSFDFTSKSSPDTTRDFVGTLLISSIDFGPLESVPRLGTYD